MILVPHGTTPSGCGLFLVGGEEIPTLRPSTPCCGVYYIESTDPDAFCCIFCGDARLEADKTYVRGRLLRLHCVSQVSSWLGYENLDVQISIEW